MLDRRRSERETGLWILRYELPDTLLVLTPTAMHVVASKKKAELVATLTDAAKAVGVTLQTHVREKDGDGSTQMTASLTALGGESPTLATLLKEKLEGTFVKVRVKGCTMPVGRGMVARVVASEVGVRPQQR